MATGQASGPNGIQRVPASLYNNPDDTDFKHVAGTTPGTEDPFSQHGTFAERVANESVARAEPSTPDREVFPPENRREDADAPAVASFPVPQQESCAQHARSEEGPAHSQHVQPSPPAHDPLPAPADPSVPVETAFLPEYVPVVTGFPVEREAPARPEAVADPPNHRNTPRHTKTNTEVEDQLNYISQGPFPEELKQVLTAEVLAFATQDGARRPRTVDDAPAAQQLEQQQQAEAETFVHQMEQALKLSGDTQQPNDPSVSCLVGCVHNFSVLVELQRANQGMHDKLCMLAPFIHQYRPVIGDGNCFYRCFAFGLVESNLWSREQLQALKAAVKQTATAAVTWLNSKQAMQLLGQDYTAFTRRARVLMEAGYKKFSAMCQQLRHGALAHGVFVDGTGTILNGVVIVQCLTLLDADHDPWPTLLSIFQGNDGEDIMHLVRQFAAYEMLSKPMQYETFLPAIEGLKGPPMLRAGEQLTVPLVVSRLVVVNGMEAEHVMIQALASLLQVSIGVVYADGEAMPQVHVIQPVHRQDGNRHPEPRIFVIFRSGHYDLVYPDSTSWLELQARTRV